jgi:phosphoglucosamine mutase
MKKHNKHNIFGTDGIRALIGTEFFDTPSLIKLGHAIAQWACKINNRPCHVLLGNDTRESCAFVKSALQTGLLLHGTHIHDAGVLPTPTICQIVQYATQFDIGIIISASHNPYHDNGIKLITRMGGKISEQDEIEITRLFYAHGDSTVQYTHFGHVYFLQDAYQTYLTNLRIFFPYPFLDNIKIVLDCANGATHSIAQKIFEYYGATVLAINNNPDGKNINNNCGALYTQSLQDAVIESQAAIGFAFDGDGDRIIAVSRSGQIKDGDDILALLTQHPSYKNEQNVVGTLMSNQGLAAHLKKQNKQLLRSQVGDKYISQLLIKENMKLGGEQSGHIIVRDYLESGDGIFIALRLLQVIIQSNNWHLETFDKFPQLILNIPITHKKDLSQPLFSSLIEQHQAQLKDGRLIVRYSGTEPLLRIMVEDADLENARSIGKKLSQALAQQLCF